MGGGTEPIGDDEILYRRIPTQPKWFDPEVAPHPTPLAFEPHRNDTTGLSVSRGKYKAPEQVAENDRGKRYYVAVLRAGDLRAHGIDVVPRPLEGDPGHAELPGLTCENRETDTAQETKVRLAHELTLEVKGPFP